MLIINEFLCSTTFVGNEADQAELRYNQPPSPTRRRAPRIEGDVADVGDEDGGWWCFFTHITAEHDLPSVRGLGGIPGRWKSPPEYGKQDDMK